MANVQHVADEEEVDAIDLECNRFFNKLTIYKFTRTWRFDVRPLGKNHEYASPVIRTQHQRDFNFTWRLVFNKLASENNFEISLLSFDRRLLEVCVRWCLIEDESFDEEILEEVRDFDFSLEAPIKKKCTLRSLQLERIDDQRKEAAMRQIQDTLSVSDKVHLIIKVYFEFLNLDPHVRRSMKLAEDLETLIKHKTDTTDVTFQIGGKELKAHKFILTARSRVFAKMFEEQETQENRYTIDDIEVDVFQCLLNFVYSGKTADARKINKLNELRIAAEKFGLKI